MTFVETLLRATTVAATVPSSFTTKHHDAGVQRNTHNGQKLTVTIANNVMKAFELRAMFDAGLQLSGQEKDGSLQFLGTQSQWRNAQNTIVFNKLWK